MRYAPMLLAALTVLPIAACAAPPALEGPVRLGQTAHVGGPRVRPERIVEDSRCPMNARCIHAGRVIVRATVSGGTWSRRIDLTLGEPVPVADGRLTLIAVTPDRMAGSRPGRRLPYRFTFDFQGGF